MELDMDSRMASDEIDWFLELVRETWKYIYIVLVLPMGMKREKLVMGNSMSEITLCPKLGAFFSSKGEKR